MSTEYFNDQWRIPNNKNQSLVSNYSMEFNGTSDFVDASVASSDVVPSSQSSWTYSSWLYLNSTHTSYQCIFERGAAYPGNGMLVRENAGTIQVYAAASVVIFTNNLLPTDEWAYFALVYDISTNELTCYINNSSQTLTMPSGWAISGTLFYIGKRQNNINFWTGKMDQVSVFDYALPATGTNSVATLYGGGTAVTNPMSLSPAPVTYYQLGDQSVSTGPASDYLVPNNSLQDYVFNFDGSGQVFNLDSEILLPDNKTVSFWFKLRVVPTGQFAIPLSSSNNRYYPLLVNNAGNFTVYIQGANGAILTNTFLPIAAGVWYNFIITGDGTTPLLYINGTQYTFGSGTDRTEVLIGDIGARPDGTFDLDGDMSNVAIWSGTTLNQTQVNNVYNNGAPSDISSLNPTAWYKLNAADTFDASTSDWTITDYAGSNDGTSFNMDSANLVQSNLQQTSGYSPYALDFDGISDYLYLNNSSANIMSGRNAISVSGWFKLNSNSTSSAVFSNWYGGDVQYLLRYNSTVGLGIQWYINSNAASTIISTGYVPNVGDWVHVVGVKDPITNGGQSRVYINGFEAYSQDSGNLSTPLANIIKDDQIGVFSSSSNRMNGSISNVAYWTDTALTQAQVTEIYNQGVPSNLNNFSGTAPAHWLQIGTNSSFNTNWTCLDEIGNINAISAGMTNDDVTNGPGYSANGLGTSSIDIKGDAPYSSANGLSENMDVLDRATDVPS